MAEDVSTFILHTLLQFLDRRSERFVPFVEENKNGSKEIPENIFTFQILRVEFREEHLNYLHESHARTLLCEC